MLRRLPVLTDPTRKKGGRGSPLVECVSCQHFVVTPGHVLTRKLKKRHICTRVWFYYKNNRLRFEVNNLVWNLFPSKAHTHTHTQYDLPPKGCMLPCTAKYPPIMCLVMHTATALLSVNVCMACTVHTQLVWLHTWVSVVQKYSKVLNLHFDNDLEHSTPVFSLDKVIMIYHKTVWLQMCESNLVDAEMVLIWLLEPSLWQWPWRQWIDPFEWHSASWRCLTAPSLVAVGSDYIIQTNNHWNCEQLLWPWPAVTDL